MVGNAAVVEANEVLDKIYKLATLLDTGLDREEVSIIAALIENGVNPEALALVVKELRQAAGLENRPAAEHLERQ
eukprot:jgi/Botrbrau1/11206/Bobra.0075s0002.1